MRKSGGRTASTEVRLGRACPPLQTALLKHLKWKATVVLDDSDSINMEKQLGKAPLTHIFLRAAK